MRAISLTLVLSCALALAACQHQAGIDATSIAEVKATQTARFEAMIDVDIDALEKILAPGLVYTHTTGSVDTREQFIESLVQRNVRYHAVDISENQVRVAGDVATSTGAATLSVSTPTLSLELAIRFIEVYVRTDGAWQLIAWQSTRLPPTP